MNPTPLAAILFVLGCALARQAPHPQPAQRPEAPAGRRIWLNRDIPSLNLSGNRFYRIDPDALLYLGDQVAVRVEESDRVMVAPYQDDLLASVVGRVVA
jgi:hypothetical protein